jgi:sugar lactone lactonase YvrE
MVPGGEPEVLLGGLAFANGLALAADASFALVVETFEFRVTRLWLTGPRAGTAEPFLDNLPGIPDNMSRGSDGLFWIAMSTPRNPALDRLVAAPGVLRQAVYQLPSALQPKPAQTVWVIAADASGRIVHDLQAPGDTFSLVTGVCACDGVVALASLDHAALATFELS